MLNQTNLYRIHAHPIIIIIIITIIIIIDMGGATGVCGGYNVPPTFGTSGVQGGTGDGPMKMIQQTVFIQYCTSD